MKTNIKFLLVALVAFSAFSITSCGDDDPAPTPTPATQTIAQIAQGNADLETLVVALNRTGLTSVLNGPGQYTVFAPTDEAFDTFFTSLSTPEAVINVNNVDEAVLKSILLNHVIGSKIMSSGIPDATYVTTLSPINANSGAPTISMFVQKAGSTVTLNGGIDSKGAVVTTADVAASNGVIHIVNRVIQIPTLVDHVIDNPDFDTLQLVVTSESGGAFGDQSAVLSALAGITAAAPATLFAPNNTAFTNATTGTGFAVGASASQVSTVLQYHVSAEGNFRSTDLTNNQSVPMITDPIQNVMIIKGSGTVDIKDSANNLSRVFEANIQASNGVIHGVNSVLQPML